ncbi:MAG: error-prone DNA polymerase [Bdellovibrio sp.]|nr:MAG: error-prone DNA polymerase [Bdellovibrio sp.]
MATSIRDRLPYRLSSGVPSGLSSRRARGFVELLARSNFSFLQGASHPEEMVEEAIRLHYKGIAICDLNGLYGVVRGRQIACSPSLFTASVGGGAATGVSVAAKPQVGTSAEDFRYLVGAELTLTDGSSLALLPQTLTGYSNLCQLLTHGKRNVAKYFSKVSGAQLREHHEGLLALLLPPLSEERYLEFHAIFGDRLYVPVWRDLSWESVELARQAFALEERQQASLFVTQRPLMHRAERKPVFDVLTCIHHHTTLEKADHILVQNAERHLRPLHELAYLWQDRPDLLETTLEIAQRIDFDMTQIRYRYPRSKLPEGRTSVGQLRALVEAGVLWRFPSGASTQVRETLEKELALIGELAYEDYFLTLHEICEFAKARGILYQGRGSAANSVVCFCLGLTSVDPNQIDLLFERFISKERGEPPDIDIDFEHERREEVIQHIYRSYGEEHAAMVCTVIRFKTRMAVRETAKVLGIPLATINALIRFMGRDGFRRLLEPQVGGCTSSAARGGSVGTSAHAPTLHAKFQIPEWKWKALLSLAPQIYGFPRHIGIHTGGFLITQDPLSSIVPVEKATMEGRYVIQWNKDDVNDLKLMKIDVLSLGMLTALRRSLNLLKEHKGIAMNLAQIPADDRATYEMIGRSETVGVFQIESRAQMNTLPRLRPCNYYDLVIEVALIRPGPLQGGMVHPFIRRRNGLEKVEYFHPDLRPVLQKTMGVPIFQEQVMKIAVVAAGFTPGEADELRRVMSAAWRRKGTMEGVRERILRGLREKGVDDKNAQAIYATIQGFANYGFPESHAASFALLSYASSYLKCHHPDVFVCALLNSQPMGFYPPRVLVAEAQRNGVEFRPVDIQFSNVEYTLEETPRVFSAPGLLPVRVGLQSIHGIARNFFHHLVSARQHGGPFASLADLVRRTQLPRAVILRLAAAGALRFLHKEPRRLIWDIEALSLDPRSFLWGHAKESFANGDSANENAANEDSANEDKMRLPFESNWQALEREYAAVGYSLGSHPLGILRSSIAEKNEQLLKHNYILYSHSKDLRSIRHGSKVRVAGLVSVTQRPPTAKGMCFVTLEDEFGFINIIIPPDVYQKDRQTIYSRMLMEIHGRLEKHSSVINVKAERVFPLVENH